MNLHARYDATAMNPNPESLRRRVNMTRWLASGSLLGLIFLGLAWELWLAPLRPGGSWWAIKVLPLCIPLAGLLKNRMYTYRWVSLLIWLYFIEAAVRGWSDRWPSSVLAMLEGLLCITLFTACTLHVRWRFQAVRLSAEPPPETP